jgi:aspartyl-tRNA(Asn)/glutamyl-tRNA(Gln) amidotransferase subunit C
MTTMTRDTVLAVAKLARLELSEAAADALTKDLDKILGYVAKLDELDTVDVAPTAQVTVAAAKLRPDVARVGLAKNVALAQAPRADEVGFLVPGFVDES